MPRASAAVRNRSRPRSPSPFDMESTPPPDKRPVRARPWTFVVSPPALRGCEVVCIVGDCSELGSWQSAAARPLSPHPAAPLWTITVDLPLDVDVSYRYCVCITSQDPPRTLVRSWETNLKPRLVPKHSNASSEPDVYGTYDGREKVDSGWLTAESVLQLKFSKAPFTFKSKFRNGTLRVKLIPVNFQFDCDNPNVEESLNADTNDSEPPACVITEVATIDSEHCRFEQQEQFGRVYDEGDFLVFRVTCPNLHSLGYLIDFYKHGSRITMDEPPRHIGYSYILPSLLKKTEGLIELPITCSTKHRPLGLMSGEYLLIRSMVNAPCDMSVSYVSYWNESWRGLDVGHRGSGSSFKTKESTSIRENSIASLKKAATSGADMIEFDVQLSKDLIPVVYHDFHVCIALKRKKNIEYSEMLEIPMQDLTLEQLQKLKVYHVVEGRANEPKFFDEDLAEHQPFPTLSEVFQAIDMHVGFNIEIKGTMIFEDGSTELEHPFDLNLYLDKILEVVLHSGGSRKIVFSSFHPDICTMLRLKQNIYPTMFLTQGITIRYPSFRDKRCNSIPSAMYHALNAGLLGIVVHTEDLLRDSSQVKLVTDVGLIIFCWGDDNNDTNTIKYLKQLGLHGVIYDKLDQYKEVKESIFLAEAREAQKELLLIASNEETNHVDVSTKNSAGVNNVNFEEGKPTGSSMPSDTA